MIDEDKCSICGRPFTAKLRREFLVNGNLFTGGVDRICHSCVERQEKLTAKRVKECSRAGE